MFTSCGFKRHKITIVYRHIRCKSSGKVLSEERLVTKEPCKHRINKLSDVLSCSTVIARKIVRKHKNISTLDEHEFCRNASFCKQHLTEGDLNEFPDVLSLNSSVLQHRYFSLNELGLCNVTANDILRFPHILKKTPKILWEEGYVFSGEYKSNILTQCLSTSERTEINSRLRLMYNNGSTLLNVKEVMNAEFLAAKLGCSIGKAYQMLHNYSPLRGQSILNTDQLLNILQRLGFSFPKVYKYPSLLSLHPEIVEQFLSEIPEILGVNTAYILQKVPHLLRRSVNSIQKAEAVLKEFNITEAQLMSCLKVMTFTPDTLEERLKILCTSEDFSSLKSCKSFLWLVYYFNNVVSRLETLKTLDVPYSIRMFTASDANFHKTFHNNERKTLISDVSLYLSGIFNVSEKKILKKFQEYPKEKISSLQNSVEVIDFLLKSGATKSQIFNGIGIIFYDANEVKAHFETLKNDPRYQPFEEWASHYNLIQLLIYTLETGGDFVASVFKAKFKDDEEVEQHINYSAN